MFSGDREYEDEVRRIARLLWPTAEGGAVIKSGRERDAVFETEEFIHVIECTVSRSKQKAIEDCVKLQKLVRSLTARHPQKFVKGWFITLNEPTADQRGVFDKVRGRIVPISFDQFRSKLVDARSYLSLRERYVFGSVRDPETGRPSTELDYVPADILDQSGQQHTIDSLGQALLTGKHFVLLGDYGIGKSATVRQLFRHLAAAFRSGGITQFPLALNLRDHHGQTDPVEAIERHARSVGFGPPETLVRAWRAGWVLLFLDGFDEIATAGWAGKTKRLRDLRYRSMELVRAFLAQTPSSSGIFLTGRSHFFDSTREMISSLGLFDCIQINLSEFNDQQVEAYLQKRGWTRGIPEWIPSRPLLLGYLASKGLLQQTMEVEAGSGPAVGWDFLLQRIADREAEIEAGIDAGTVRRLIEHVATIARASADGLGPVTPEQITAAFVSVCGYPPDDRGAVLLQRLPGLGASSAEDGSRVFIDRDLAEVAKGGTIFGFMEDPFGMALDPDPWQTTMWPIAAEVCAYKCQRSGCGTGRFDAAFRAVASRFRSHTLAADVFLVLTRLGIDYEGPVAFIKEVIIPELTLDQANQNLSSVELQECLIGNLDVSSDLTAARLPRFVRCYFGTIDGFAGKDDLPREAFVDPEVDSFENPAKTTNAILSLSLPLAARVLLTILKKMYAQRGSGRRESALYRGLDARAQQMVPDVLRLLRAEGFCVRSKQAEHNVWLPSKSSELRRRALAMLTSPASSSDRLFQQTREL